jgi:hypothetical protein
MIVPVEWPTRCAAFIASASSSATISLTYSAMESDPLGGDRAEPSRSGQMTLKLPASTARRACQVLLVPPRPWTISTASPSRCCSTSNVLPLMFMPLLPNSQAGGPAGSSSSLSEMAELGANQIRRRLPQIVDDIEMVATLF